jgi:predicted acyl esterase
MHDSVQIAADVWLPQDYQAGQRLPVLLRTTRYGRDGQFGWAYRLAVASRNSRQNARPLIPGKPAELQICMWPTSILLRKGHQIRIALRARTPVFSDGTRLQVMALGPSIDRAR